MVDRHGSCRIRVTLSLQVLERLLCSQEGEKGGSQGKGGPLTEGLRVWRHDSHRAHDLAQIAKQGTELAVLVLEEAADASNGKGGKSEPYALKPKC